MATEAPSSGIDAVVDFLETNGIRHEVVEHRRTTSAAAEARAAGVPLDDVAKVVLLREDGEYRLAVIPASERLDLRKARAALGASAHLRLASEDEMAADFPGWDIGALPPLGTLLKAPEAMDERLLQHPRILCCGGDHEHGVLVDPRDLTRVTGARVADLRAD